MVEPSEPVQLRVVGEHTGHEQGEVVETPLHAGTLCLVGGGRLPRARTPNRQLIWAPEWACGSSRSPIICRARRPHAPVDMAFIDRRGVRRLGAAAALVVDDLVVPDRLSQIT